MMQKMMKAVFYEGPNMLSIRETPIPEPAPGEALLRILYSGICGSDIHVYRGEHKRGKTGVILCHEFVGEIVTLPSTVCAELMVGCKVVAEPTLYCGRCEPCMTGSYNICASRGIYGIDQHGSLAEYMAVPVDKLYPVPEEVDSLQAALVEPLAVALHAAGLSGIQPGKNVLILGGGPIGALLAFVCRLGGVGCLVVSEINDYRSALLNKLGIITTNPLRENLSELIDKSVGKYGFDLVFEVAGLEATMLQATAAVKARGRIVIVSNPVKPLPFDLFEISNKELEVVGSRTYTSRNFHDAIRMLASGQLTVSGLISKVFPLSQADQAIKLAAEGKDTMKILVQS
jgi:(R,R)-butanediol dehydrogenase / meso-butanediol dehydrogenase / diacetyl reductase